MDWVNRVGIILNFLSFWFVAPEFLGEERLRKWEQRLEMAMRASPPVLKHFNLMLGAGLTLLFISGILIGYADRVVAFSHEYSPLEAAIMMLPDKDHLWFFASIIGVIFSFSLLLKEIISWWETSLLPRLLTRLADDSHVRERALKIGIAFFIIGNVMQFVATFDKK